MTDVDDAIQRAEETGWQNASSGEVHQAYRDRDILAAEVKKLRRFIPPDGWSQFGTHANCKSAYLEFSEEVGEDGLPQWERVVTRLENDDDNLVIWKEERDRAE